MEGGAVLPRRLGLFNMLKLDKFVFLLSATAISKAPD